jgi:hypothetical protein
MPEALEVVVYRLFWANEDPVAEEGAVAMLHVDSRARGLARRFLRPRTITLHVSVRMKLMIKRTI